MYIHQEKKTKKEREDAEKFHTRKSNMGECIASLSFDVVDGMRNEGGRREMGAVVREIERERVKRRG